MRKADRGMGVVYEPTQCALGRFRISAERHGRATSLAVPNKVFFNSVGIDVVKGDELCFQVAPGRRSTVKQENLVDPSPMREQQIEAVSDIVFESIRIGFVNVNLLGEELVARSMVEVDPVGGGEKDKWFIYGDSFGLCVDKAGEAVFNINGLVFSKSDG